MLSRQKLYILLTATILSIVLTLSIGNTHWGKGRFEQTSIVSEVSGVKNKIQDLVFNEDSIYIARVFNNKVIGYGTEFISQYSKYVSIDYLFGEAGRPQMYNAPFIGILYLSMAMLIGVSFLFPIQKSNGNISIPLIFFFLYMIIISPIPSALTITEVPNIQRSALTPILFLLIATYGAHGILSFQRFRRKFLLILLFSVGVEIAFFSHQYFHNFNYYTSFFRNDGNKQLVTYLIENHDKYDEVYVTSEEAWLPTNYLFYTKNYSPSFMGKFKQNFRINEIGNIKFPDNSCPSTDVKSESIQNNSSKKILIIDSINCSRELPKLKGLEFVTSIKRLNEMEIFLLYSK